MDTSNNFTQPSKDVINDAGVPREHQLFAVFDSAQEAQAAEWALEAQSVHPVHLQGAFHAQTLQGPDQSANLLKKVERFAKYIGGESHEAERYATYLDSGRIVLAMEAADQDAARRIARTLILHGGYDVTYFRGWAIEYMSPEANAKRGISTHNTSNVAE